MDSQARELVLNILTYFQQEKENGGPLINISKVTERVCAATGISERTIYRIKNEARQLPSIENCKVHLKKPGTKRPRESPATTLDSFDESVLHRTIERFYAEGTIPYLGSLLQKLKEEIGYVGSRSSLYRLLVKLGYKYTKVDRRRFLIRRPDVVALRRVYLRKINSIRMSNPDREIYFLDESYVNERHVVGKCWSSDKVKGLEVSPGVGRRVIICHAGSKNGFVEGAKLVFPSNSGKADYHHDMNSITFKKWFIEQLLPNIKPNSVIVMDNAPYHSVQLDKAPTTASLKSEMQDWLKRRNIPFDSSMTKPELYELVKINKEPNRRYEIDEIAKAHGHEVIRLPPYNCDLNPIELIWGRVKNSIARKNSTQKLSDLLRLTGTEIDAITALDWQSVVQHTQQIEETYWKDDIIIDRQVDQMIIRLRSGDENCSDSSDSESNSD